MSAKGQRKIVPGHTVPKWDGKKNPRRANGTDAGSPKQPRRLDTDHAQIMDRRPVWRFGEFDHDGPWGLSNLTAQQTLDLVKKLGEFESMTLKELGAPGDPHFKRYDVATMPSQGPNRLTEIGHDDETEVARLRLSAKCRLYGFMREHVFHVLWYDPEHAVYPSAKKHT